MSRFIETIPADHGAPAPLEYHQERVDKTLRDWDSPYCLDLAEARLAANPAAVSAANNRSNTTALRQQLAAAPR